MNLNRVAWGLLALPALLVAGVPLSHVTNIVSEAEAQVMTPCQTPSCGGGFARAQGCKSVRIEAERNGLFGATCKELWQCPGPQYYECSRASIKLGVKDANACQCAGVARLAVEAPICDKEENRGKAPGFVVPEHIDCSLYEVEHKLLAIPPQAAGPGACPDPINLNAVPEAQHGQSKEANTVVTVKQFLMNLHDIYYKTPSAAAQDALFNPGAAWNKLVELYQAAPPNIKPCLCNYAATDLNAMKLCLRAVIATGRV